jgi:hypothetical protein
MAKQFPLNEVICLDVLGFPLRRGDFVLVSTGFGFDLGMVKKPGKIQEAVGAIVTMFIKNYGYNNRTLYGQRLLKIPAEQAVSKLTQAKLSGDVTLCPAGEQLLVKIKRQRERENAREKKQRLHTY